MPVLAQGLASFKAKMAEEALTTFSERTPWKKGGILINSILPLFATA